MWMYVGVLVDAPRLAVDSGPGVCCLSIVVYISCCCCDTYILSCCCSIVRFVYVFFFFCRVGYCIILSVNATCILRSGLSACLWVCVCGGVWV